MAHRPFINTRPLATTTAIVGFLLCVLTFHTIYSSLDAWAQLRSLRAHIEANQAQIELAKENTKQSRDRLDDREARRIREVAASVAGIIQKRRISWTRLFDEIGEALPDDVRVLTVAPDTQGTKVQLLLNGLAKDNTAKLRFLTRLNRPPFADGRLMGETLEGDRIRFSISCDYDPEASNRDDGEASAIATDETPPPRRAGAADGMAGRDRLASLVDPRAGRGDGR